MSGVQSEAPQRHKSTIFSLPAYLLSDGTSGKQELSKWELEWQKRADRSNMKTGRIIFGFLTLGAARHSWRQWKNFSDPHCTSVQTEGWQLALAISLEAFLALTSSIVLYLNYRCPENKQFYGALLSLWYMFVTVMGFPPFTPLCGHFVTAFVGSSSRSCNKDELKWMMSTLVNADCTIQGPTMTQVLMMWILCSYYYVPSHQWMKWNWAYIFFFYLPVNWAWMHFGPPEEVIYKPGDVWFSVILLCACQTIASARKFFMELSHLQKARLDFIEKVQARAMLISLRDQLPEHVITPLLSQPGIPYAHPVPCVSILFIMIDEFDEKARTTDVKKLLEFLNDTFSRWDQIMVTNDVTIIETVREEYVCAVGVLPEHEKHGIENHQKILGNLINAAIGILSEQTDEVKVKMGIHTGEIFTGVIGKKLPRFRLFGDVINTTARMMQKSPVGMLQFGKETYRYVKHPEVVLPPTVSIVEEKGVYMKGKGKIDVYRLSLASGSFSLCGSLVGALHSTAAVGGEKSMRRKSVSALDFAIRRMGTTKVDKRGRNHLGLDAEDTSLLVKPKRSMQGETIMKKRSILPEGVVSTRTSKQSVQSRHSLRPDQAARRLEVRQQDSTSSGQSKRSGLRFQVSDEVVEVSVMCSDNSLPHRLTEADDDDDDDDSDSDTVSNLVSEELSTDQMLWQASEISLGDENDDDDLSESEEARLEELMKEISKGRRRSLAKWKKWISFRLRTGFFDDAAELQWFDWQHQNLMLHKLDARLYRHEVVIVTITAFDCAMYCCLFSWHEAPFSPHRLYGKHPAIRSVVFLLARLMCYLMVAWWRQVVHENRLAAKNSEVQTDSPPRQQSFLQHARVAQAALLFSYHVLIILFTVSYDAISNAQDNWIHNAVVRWGEQDSEVLQAAFEDKLGRHWRYSTINAFMLSLAGYVFATSHPWPFGHCLSFVALLIFLYSVHESSFWKKGDDSIVSLYFSSIGFVVLFAVFAVLFLRTSWLLERDSRGRFKAIKNLEETRSRFEDILSRLMPPNILDEMNELPPGEKFPSHPYKHCTVAQSDLSGFTALASSRTPSEVVQLVSDLFGRFDTFADKRGVWKVETVGDAYIAAAAELPLTANSRALNVLVFGQDMIRQVHAWAQSYRIQVTCRVGIHHGECIGGIASTHMRRYHLFGDLMSVVEVLESTGALSRVQISRACKAKVEQEFEEDGPLENEMEVVGFREREDALVTSKGEEHSYDEVGGRTFLVDFIDELPPEPPLLPL